MDKWEKGGSLTFFCRGFFCFTLPKNFIREHFTDSLFLGIWKKGDKRGAGITVYRQTYFSHSGKKFRKGTHPRFRKLLVLKIFMHKRGYHEFPSRKFCRKVQKKFLEETFSVSLFSSIENFIASEG